MADGVGHEGCDGDGLEFGQAESCDVGVEVGDSQGGGEVAEVVEELHSSRRIPQAFSFFGASPGGDKVLGLSGVVEGDDDAIACAGQRPGAVGHALEDIVEVEVCVDALDGLA